MKNRNNDSDNVVMSVDEEDVKITPANKNFNFTLQDISYNAPVVLTFTLISLVVLILDQIFKGHVNHLLFSVYRSDADNIFYFFRLFGHCLGHANWSHFYGNMMLFLLLGPILEEKYGSTRLLIMIIITALVSGLANILVCSHSAILGSSGIVFMMIILTSASCIKDKKIPLTMILILIIYLGAEIWDGIFANDNVSHLSHIIGGFCGAFFGFYSARREAKKAAKKADKEGGN